MNVDAWYVANANEDQHAMNTYVTHFLFSTFRPLELFIFTKIIDKRPNHLYFEVTADCSALLSANVNQFASLNSVRCVSNRRDKTLLLMASE